MYSPRDARSFGDDAPDLLAVLRCPRCGGALDLAAHAVACAACPALYPRDGVIRFVDRAAYAESFGLQWKAFPQVRSRIDSVGCWPITAPTGSPPSWTRASCAGTATDWP